MRLQQLKYHVFVADTRENLMSKIDDYLQEALNPHSNVLEPEFLGGVYVVGQGQDVKYMQAALLSEEGYNVF